jgi:hypothetical protein
VAHRIEGTAADLALARAATMDGAVAVQSFGLVGIVGEGKPWLLLRCPGFDHDGIPRGGDCDFTWNLLYGGGEAVATLVIEWEGAGLVERRLSFDLDTSVRRFFFAVVEFGGKVAVTQVPGGEIPGPEDTLGLELPQAWDDEVFVEIAALALALERASE